MYNVQCLCGYVGTAPQGSELETRCKEHKARGYLDALILAPSECPECKYDDAEMRNQQAQRILSDWEP